MAINWVDIGKNILEMIYFWVAVCTVSWVAGVFFTMGQELVYSYQANKEENNGQEDEEI